MKKHPPVVIILTIAALRDFFNNLDFAEMVGLL